MVVGELVPKNRAIARPLPIAPGGAGPQRGFTAAFRPVIAHLNNTANRLVRRSASSPPRSWPPPAPPRSWSSLARHSAERGALEADTADAVRPHAAARRRRGRERDDPAGPGQRAAGRRATAADVVERHPGDRPVPLPGLRGTAWTTSSASCTSRTCRWCRRRAGATPRRAVMGAPLLVPETLALDAAARPARQRGCHRRRRRRVRRYGRRGHAGGHRRGGRRRGPRRARRGRAAGPPVARRRLAARPALLRPDEVAELTGIELPRDAGVRDARPAWSRRPGPDPRRGRTWSELRRVADTAAGRPGWTAVRADQVEGRRERRGRPWRLAGPAARANAFFVGAEFALISARSDRRSSHGRGPAGRAVTLRAWSTCRR